jgi:two-component system response regulator AtoC
MATLLIVDDDTLIRDTLHDLLSSSHDCHTADRAEQALAYLEIETYDAVLTDISMPGLSGRDLLRHIQAEHPDTPVIVISGDSDGGDGQRLLEMGAFAFFNKPFQLDEVEAAVDRAIAYHHEVVNTVRSERLPDDDALDSESSNADTDSSN